MRDSQPVENVPQFRATARRFPGLLWLSILLILHGYSASSCGGDDDGNGPADAGDEGDAGSLDVVWDLEDSSDPAWEVEQDGVGETGQDLEDGGDLADGLADVPDEETGTEGHPPAEGELGAACESIRDCDDGFCITNDMFEGFDGGYCTGISCNPERTGTCGEYGTCVEIFPGMPTVCVRTCEGEDDCRDDQDCVGLCLPGGFTSEPERPGVIEAEDSFLDGFLDAVDQERLERRLSILSGAQPWVEDSSPVTIGSRAVGSPDHELAVNYIMSELESAGLTPQRLDFEWNSTDCTNIEAVLQGSDTSLAPILVTGHYDTVASSESSWDPYSDPAPGAVDNGTGVAFVLEMADVLGEISDTDLPARSVHFLVFDCEELGLYGSEQYVQDLQDNEEDIGCMLNLDMVGWDHPALPDRLWYTYSGDHEDIGVLGLEAFEVFSDVIPIPSDYDVLGGSDHMPFLEAGMCVTSLSTFPTRDSYHTFEDTMETLDWTFYSGVVRGSAANLAAWLYYGDGAF